MDGKKKRGGGGRKWVHGERQYLKLEIILTVFFISPKHFFIKKPRENKAEEISV